MNFISTRLLSIIFLISIPLTSFSQQKDCDCYERLRNLANYHFYQGQHEEGLSVMKKAISFGDKNTTRLDYIMLSLFYSKNDSLEQTYQSILKGVEKGLSINDLNADFFSEVKEGLGKIYWDKIINNYDKHRLIYLSSLNLEYRLSIEWLKGSDQRIRANDKTKENLDFVDSLNFSELLELFNEYGFPTTSQHGFNWRKIDAFMLHYSVNSSENLHQVLNILAEASSKCQCDKGFIPLISDRYNRWIDKSNQDYGVWNLWTDKGVFGTIDNVATVDNRRMKYNLLRLLEQSKLEKRSLPDGYKAIDYPENYFCGYQFQNENK